MIENEKRIVVRVDRDEWEKLDRKRYDERISFQELGLNLLRKWYENATDEQLMEAAPETPDLLSPEDAAAVRAFIELLREGGPNDRQLALLAVNAWTSKKTPIPESTRAVKQIPGRKRSSA